MVKIQEATVAYLAAKISTGEYHVRLGWIFSSGELSEQELIQVAEKLYIPSEG